jgi:hypothetical protein
MKAPIQLRSSLVAGNVPVSLKVGELGINEADSLLFYRNPTGVVTSFNLAGGGGGGGAPINSPVFTGDPRAPTPIATDNDTSIATTAFVKAQSYLTSADLSTYAPLASPALSGNPTAPTPAAGDADTSIATTAFVATYFEKLHGIGQCYLSLSGANLLLAPFSGNLILINGALVTIPDAGVTLAPTSTAATTLYYIYAYLSSGTLTLEYSTTAYATQTGTGVKIKSGDATRTLVGMWCSASAGVWSTSRTEGVSYFNPQYKTQYAGAVGISTTSTTFAEMISTSRVNFISFAGRVVSVLLHVRCYNDTNTASYICNVALDTLANPQIPIDMRYQQATAVGSWGNLFGAITQTYTEARHFMTPMHKESSGTGTADSHYIEVGVWG